MTAPHARRTPLRILCVEQDPIQRKLLEASLEVMGANALVVARALDAVWVFRRKPVDLVFLDIDQHVANGLMAFEAIRATPIRGKAVPILAVTENELGWSEANYREAGFAGMFRKPVEPTRLFRAIDEVLDNRRLVTLQIISHKEPRRAFGHAMSRDQ